MEKFWMKSHERKRDGEIRESIKANGCKRIVFVEIGATIARRL